MKALIYKGPGQKSWDEVPDPTIREPTDVIVKMDATTICGTDLHIFKGDVPEVEIGRVLGHEGIGEATEIGDGVTRLAVGDRVIPSCVSSCGRCSNCRQGSYSHCLDPEGLAGIGWIFGYMIDGTQTDYVWVPFAEDSVYKVPEGMTDAEGILLSDILPTGFEIGVRYGQVSPGDLVAVIGSGPVGLSAVMTSELAGRSTDGCLGICSRASGRQHGAMRPALEPRRPLTAGGWGPSRRRGSRREPHHHRGPP